MVGSIVALITPFNEDNEIDFAELERLCNFHLENRTDGLLLLGTTAESEALTAEEKKKLVDFVYQKVYPKIRIMIGLISNITEEVVKQSKFYDDYDIDSFLVINPYYNKTNESGLLKHFTYIADRTSKPIVLYNVPKRTGMGIPVEVVRALSYHKNIIGIKEASGDLLYQLKISSFLGENFRLYCGDDSLMLPSLYLGASGVISVLGNAFPAELKLITESFKKNPEISRTAFFKLFDLMNVMMQEVSPIGIKYVLYLMGFNTLHYRRPLDEPSKELKRKLEREILNIIDE